jgi:hypothetical protein
MFSLQSGSFLHRFREQQASGGILGYTMTARSRSRSAGPQLRWLAIMVEVGDLVTLRRSVSIVRDEGDSGPVARNGNARRMDRLRSERVASLREGKGLP